MTAKERTDVHERTQELLQGPLKHVKAAALAAALLPLASVAVSPAVAQAGCSGGALVGDVVWYDANNNGIQDAGEPGIADAVVTMTSLTSPDTFGPIGTGQDGSYLFGGMCAGTYRVAVQIPPGMQPSPANQGGDDERDSDGVADSFGNSTADVEVPTDNTVNLSIDFGFWSSPVEQPGTGTPGYWMNHPEAWPVDSIAVGGVTYTKDEAIAWLWTKGRDRTLAMFSALVPAKLNVLIGNDDSCVATTIAAADDWMATYGPVGSNVHPASLAWKIGEPLFRALDNYNNGMLCAPSRNTLE